MAEDDERNVPALFDCFLKKCGKLAHLAVDTSMTFIRISYIIGQVWCTELYAPLVWEGEPLLRTLHEELSSEHSCCFQPLKLLTITLSGSMASGIGMRQSDVDYMFEYGPVSWICQTISAQIPAAHYSMCGSALPVMRLRLLETLNAGFYLVMIEPGPDCRHEGWMPLSAEKVRHLTRWKHMCEGIAPPIAVCGPAINFGSEFNFDMVACIKLPFWPEKGALERLRRLEWLPAPAVQDIEQGGLYLVPVGCYGSPTEKTEWRLSFSRPETITVLHMAPVQKRTMRALKLCKWQLESKGKAVKSYYILTALFWLSLEMPLRQWTSVTYAAGCVLTKLQQAIEDRFLPCFFMASINVLQTVTEDVWRDLSEAVSRMRQKFIPMVLQGVCQDEERWRPLLKSENTFLSEDQLRRCLVRVTVIQKVQQLMEHIAYITTHTLCRVQYQIRMSESWWQHITHCRNLLRAEISCVFLEALVMAPAEVAHRVQLKRTGDVTWSWDVAPLVELLTDDDVEEALFHNKEAVFRWCDAQNALPAETRVGGVPADLRSLRGLTQLLTTPVVLFMSLCDTDHHWPVRWEGEIQERAKAASKGVSFDVARALRVSQQHCINARISLGLDERRAAQFARRYLLHALGHCLNGNARAEFERYLTEELDPWGLDRYLELRLNK